MLYVDEKIVAQTCDDDPEIAEVGIFTNDTVHDGIVLSVAVPGGYVEVDLDVDGAQRAIDALTASIHHLTARGANA